MKKIWNEALKNRKIAAIVLGQAIVDEGYIGTDTITLRYNSKIISHSLWKIANKWNWANQFQKHIYVDNRKPNEKKVAWRFNLKRKSVQEIYKIVGCLLDPQKDKRIQHLIRIGKIGRNKTVTKEKILKEIDRSPKSVTDLSIKFNLTSKSIRHHLRKLINENRIWKKETTSYGKIIYTTKL